MLRVSWWDFFHASNVLKSFIVSISFLSAARSKKAPGKIQGPRTTQSSKPTAQSCLVHPVHAAAVVMAATRSFLLLRNLRDHGLGRQHQSSDGSRVLQRSARNLRRVDD